MKTLALSFPSALWLVAAGMLILPHGARAQTSPVTSMTVTPPAGTAASPLFVMDSDSGTAPQTRNTIPAAVTVTFQRSSSGTSVVFRMEGDLLPASSSIPVNVVSSSRFSATQKIDLKGTGTVTHTFTLALKPNEALGAGAAFRVRAQLQLESSSKVFTNVGSSVTSTGFTVVHFRDATASTNLNVHAHLTSAATITKGFALAANAAQRDFQVRVPLLITRYDLGDVARDVTLRTTVTLLDDLGAVVALASGAEATTTLSGLGAFSSGSPNTPVTRSQTLLRNFRPAAQLDSVNRAYRVRVRVEIQDDAVNTAALRDLGNLANLSGQRLLHFNGTLRFTGGAQAAMNSITNTPAPGALEPNPPNAASPSTNRIRTVLNVSGGALAGQAGMTFAAVSNLDARLAPDGTAEVVTMPVTTVTPPPGAELSGAFGRIKVSYASPRLTSAGLVADAVINLPQGLGFTPARSTSRNKLLRLLPAITGVTLDSDLRHTGSIGANIAGADAWVFDEARPVWFKVTRFSFATSGELGFANAGAEWAHRNSFDQLASQQAAGQHQQAAMQHRLTNDGWLRSLKNTGEEVSFTAAPDGSARTQSAVLVLNEGEVRPHFPSAPAGSPDLRLAWTGAGTVQIENGKIKAGSALTGAQGFTVAYESACLKAGCHQPAQSLRTVTCTPQGGAFLLTPDGGLECDAAFGAPFALAWDRRGSAEEFSHQTGKFSAAGFFMPGHQSYAAETRLPDARAPGALLNAGLAGQTLIYPQTRAYLEGQGLYAGLNFAVSGGAQVEGEIMIADMTSGILLPLRPGVSKYYARRGGITGRHVAQTAPDALQLYGYPFGFTKMEMAFLSNSMDGVAEPSRVNGEVRVPKVKQPAQTEFTQKFTGLEIACLGALGGGDIDPADTGEKTLSYWDGKFSSKAIRFVTEDGGNCGGGNRLLSILVESGAANIEEPLSGSLIFLPNGNISGLPSPFPLLNPVVDGRLGLPAVVRMRGPRKGGSDAAPEFETYEMTPLSKLYFNDALDPRAPDAGFVTFGAVCQVPFFQVLQVQVITSANGVAAAPFHLASGWREDGLTYLNNQFFDRGHRGFPPADQVVSFLQYRNPSPNSQNFRIRARQSIFGIRALNEALTWNAVTRDFTADKNPVDNLLVMKLEHQLLYLSAERAELTFGAQFPDLKHLNLANAAVEGLERLHNNAHKQVNQGARRLRRGIDRLDDLVKDRLDKWIEDYSEAVTTSIFNKLHKAFEDSYNEHVINGPLSFPEWVNRQNGKLKEEVDRLLATAGDNPAGPFRDELRKLATGLGGTSDLLGEIKDALDEGILALDIVAGRFRVDEEGNPIPTVFGRQPDGSLVPPIEGDNARLGFIVENPDTGEREIASNLVRELVKASLPPNLAGVADSIFNASGAATAADQALNELLAEADPALDSITEALQQVKGVLVDTRSQVAAIEGLGREIANIVNSVESGALLDGIVNEIRDSIFTFMDDAARAAVGGPLTAGQKVIGLYQEISEKALSTFLKTQLRDKLMQSGIIQDIQHLLRQRLAELRHHLHSSIDTLYERLNKITKKIAKKYLAPIDEQVNKILGDLPDVIGANSVDGYADIAGDTLRRLRLDAKVELSLPEKMQLEAFFEMSCFDSSTNLQGAGQGLGCPGANGEKTVEVRLAALDIPLAWTPSAEPAAATTAAAAGAANPNAEKKDKDLRANLGLWFGFAGGFPNSIGGSFEMTSGEIDFQSVIVSDIRAAVGIGFDQAYLAAGARAKVSEYEGAGGVFFGRTCSLEPLRILDPNVADLLGPAPFTGAYVAGEVWVPISEVVLGVPATCMFRVSAGVGAGVFYSADGPVFGGRLDLGLSGEALCAVSFGAELRMVGVLTPQGFNYRGRAIFSAVAGVCPFCLPFEEPFTVTYKDGAWDFDRR